MTRDDKLIIQGFVAASNGTWAGDNPYVELDDRIAWLEGFISYHQRPRELPVETEVTIDKFQIRIARALARMAIGCGVQFHKPT